MITKHSTRMGKMIYRNREFMTGDLLYHRRIKSHSYDQENGVLSISFDAGNSQEFCKVPGAVYQRLNSASDQNKYFNENIYGNYQIN